MGPKTTDTPDRPEEVARYRTLINLPPWLDRLSARVARWPWSIIIILAALLMLFYSILTSDFYRRALVFVTDDPRLSTDQFTSVVYDVRGPDGEISRVRGIVTGSEGDEVIIQTQPEVLVRIPQGDIGQLTCEPPADNGCPVGATATVVRSRISGRLLREDAGRFDIATDTGEVVQVRKIAANQETQVRTPEGCSATPNGTCQIALDLLPERPENIYSGAVTESDAEAIVVQTAQAEYTQVNTAAIVDVVNAQPAVCALNNIKACDEGIFLTLGVTFLAFSVAVVLGLIFGLMRLSSNPVLYNVSTVYVEVIRGVPLLVILLFVNFALAPWLRDSFPALVPGVSAAILVMGVLLAAYYVLTRWPVRRAEPVAFLQPIVLTVTVTGMLLVVVTFLGANSDLAPVLRGILGLSFGYGAFLAELFRAGIQSIGKGQTEAARSLGMNYLQSMRFVILPQAFRVVLPPLGNEFIAILKDTSLLVILALPELTQKARLFAADTFRPFEAYITIGALYLVMTLFLSFLVRTVERRVSLPR
ncbi:MAG: ABC transporter permease subunit [Anaerolineae bacterium]|nr:ABC transporter permease subunit [Anaerolineae bacterium]